MHALRPGLHGTRQGFSQVTRLGASVSVHARVCVCVHVHGPKGSQAGFRSGTRAVGRALSARPSPAALGAAGPVPA